ncbi:unnamed protein product [Spirodela intermedia]|uniref:N-acetylglucosaminylphosphatidylinositol deacetylase n=1 Tax=Spirodela intermedia TaxID=51605 RepID=A0A7I8JPK2_SPIIN|nr:unnamed protein product [Spirodela intermedia]CAA6671483.1 unnamed protein product [Spirodela intermedia]
MAWMWMATVIILLWAVSLWKVIHSSTMVPSKFQAIFHGENAKNKKVLLVVAHPDDESMFFSPTIIFLISQGHSLHILCMSTGNAGGKGSIRKEELYQACAVPSRQVKVVDHPKLQDGFNEPWDHGLLATIIGEQIKMLEIDTIITFDGYGISGHPNHRDVRHGLRNYLRESENRDEAWELISKGILRKYIGPVDVWLSIFHCLLRHPGQTCCFLNASPRRSYRAMAEHQSQWLWFRKLFVLFSSYTYMNTLRKVSSH